MILQLPRGILLNTEDVPQDFEKQVQEAFTEYTRGTAATYTYQDKLAFIDACVNRLNEAKDSEEAVGDYLKDRFMSDLKSGQFPEQEDYFDLCTMEDIYGMGKESQKLHKSHYDDRHQQEQIEQITLRLITAVIEWKPGEEES